MEFTDGAQNDAASLQVFIGIWRRPWTICSDDVGGLSGGVSQRVEVHLRARRFGGQPSRGLPTVAHALFSKRERRLAEGEGFEPPVPFRVQWFSRPPPSTTRPSLRGEVILTLYADHRLVGRPAGRRRSSCLPIRPGPATDVSIECRGSARPHFNPPRQSWYRANGSGSSSASCADARVAVRPNCSRRPRGVDL